MTPFLDLRHIAIDPTLAQHLPPGLARYYEALPVAREGNSVTVAMSHPENVTALAVLTQLFHAEIVPIRTDGAAVRSALQQLYARESTEPRGLLAWLPNSLQPAWSKALSEQGLITDEMPMTWLDAETIDSETLLAAAHGRAYQLTLCTLPDVSLQSALLRDSNAPLWLVPGGPIQPRRILLVLRGFASDEVALNWVLALLQQSAQLALAEPALAQPAMAAPTVTPPTVALLPIMGQAPWGAISYLRKPGATQSQITDFAQRLEEAGIQTTLTLQSGEPRQQVAHAMRQGAYDMMVVAAEGYGQFVGQLLADLEEKCTWPLGGVLVLKPSHEHAQRLTYTASSQGSAAGN